MRYHAVPHGRFSFPSAGYRVPSARFLFLLGGFGFFGLDLGLLGRLKMEKEVSLIVNNEFTKYTIVFVTP